ncbi:TraB/GumN family protein [Desulfobotulus sp. H1]|uniref:TraB/GumN family protein n=1 Tax=Desulfobotulus pelophilus TaxID=2823377 RepID=A0ABT3N705_9BACT|nr:TraB/GumN family protein [Desulfobotulus pelophilus]MCW7753238.1 TraB/GumN family protein [Desulfobotulus pelophilus]
MNVQEPACKLPESDHLTILRHQDKTIYLLGTAHVSRNSAEETENLIRSCRPDTVSIELCASRHESLTSRDRWENMDILQVIREKKAFLLLSNLMLAAFQKRIADRMEIRPGEEMQRAMETAAETGAALHLADREVRITLARIWGKMGFMAKAKLLYQLLISGLEADSIQEEEIERLKNQDAMASLMKELAGTHPVLQDVLIDERDRYLAEKIRTAPGNTIVAIVGAGHVPGIIRYWETPVNLASLETTPPPAKTGKILKWLLPALILLLFAAGFFLGGKDTGMDMITFWFIANGVFAGIGAAASLAHPLTILTAIAAAPLTSLNPMVAAGWVAGLTEVFLRKPRVGDMQSLSRDITSMKGFWKNKATRILLVVVFTNLGSAVGTFVALPLMLRVLG